MCIHEVKIVGCNIAFTRLQPPGAAVQLFAKAENIVITLYIVLCIHYYCYYYYCIPDVVVSARPCPVIVARVQYNNIMNVR